MRRFARGRDDGQGRSGAIEVRILVLGSGEEDVGGEGSGGKEAGSGRDDEGDCEDED